MLRLRHLASGFAFLRMREFDVRAARCPFCGPSVFVRLNADESGVRCLRCAASTVHVALGWVLGEERPDLAGCDACELSARGPLAAYLRRRARSVALSEYFADAPSGTLRDGVRNEDVQRLGYADASFDLITHTEVLEHVPDDARALAELRRVLRPGGLMIFTVPLHDGECTVERARLRDGVTEHLREPVYHTDPLRGGRGILAFRDYGSDILDRLRSAGFIDARLVSVASRVPWTGPRRVVRACKPG